jgi:hypothetical protein
MEAYKEVLKNSKTSWFRNGLDQSQYLYNYFTEL